MNIYIESMRYFQEAQSLAEYHGLTFLETSAKTGLNVEEAFTSITQQIYDKIGRGEYKASSSCRPKINHF